MLFYFQFPDSQHTDNACGLIVGVSSKSDDVVNEIRSDEVAVELSSEDNDNSGDKLHERSADEDVNKYYFVSGRNSSETPIEQRKLEDKERELSADIQIIESPMEHSDNLTEVVYEIYSEEHLNQNYSSNVKSTFELTTDQSGDSLCEVVQVRDETTHEASSLKHVTQNYSQPTEMLRKSFIEPVIGIGDKSLMVNIDVVATDGHSNQTVSSKSEMFGINTDTLSGQLIIERSNCLENAISEENTIQTLDNFPSVAVNGPSEIADKLKDNDVLSVCVNVENQTSARDSREDYETRLEDNVLFDTGERNQISILENAHNRDFPVFPGNSGNEFNERETNHDLEGRNEFPIR